MQNVTPKSTPTDAYQCLTKFPFWYLIAHGIRAVRFVGKQGHLTLDQTQTPMVDRDMSLHRDVLSPLRPYAGLMSGLQVCQASKGLFVRTGPFDRSHGNHSVLKIPGALKMA